MERQIVHITIKDSKAVVRIVEDKVFSWTVKGRADLEELIKLTKDKYGKDTIISINYIDKGKNVTINSNYVRKIIYPLFRQYKRIRYEPDRLIEVSVSNKDIQKDRVRRLKQDIVRARKSGNISLVDRLFDEYLKLSG